MRFSARVRALTPTHRLQPRLTPSPDKSIPQALLVWLWSAVLLAVAGMGVAAHTGTTVLFIGNSFTYGGGSAVRYYRAASVTDLNHEGQGGVPALFKSFTDQVGLDYDVFLETRGGSGLEFHLENKLPVIGRRPWDKVVMHGQSTLDFEKPGDPAKLIRTTRQMVEHLRARNANVEVHLLATWSRADQTYGAKGAWGGKTIAAMAADVRAGYDRAATGLPSVKSVIPVGEAWTRAIETDVADGNPYDGIDGGKLNLWTYDHYHASIAGSYLEALVVFGSLTGRDPRSLSENECSGFELGLSRAAVKALQQVAFDQLGSGVSPAPVVLTKPISPERCSVAR